jgi:hypothetical protein
LYEHLAALAHNQGFDNLTKEYNRSKSLKVGKYKKPFTMSENEMERFFASDLANKFSEEELELLKAYFYTVGDAKFRENIL